MLERLCFIRRKCCREYEKERAGTVANRPRSCNRYDRKDLDLEESTRALQANVQSLERMMRDYVASHAVDGTADLSEAVCGVWWFALWIDGV